MLKAQSIRVWVLYEQCPITLQFSTKILWVLYNTKISEVKEGVCKTSSDADRVYDEAIPSQ